MKRIIYGLLSAALFVLLTAFISTNQHDGDSDPAVYKLMEVTYLWDLLKDGYEPIRERDDTWLHEGFRSKYAMAKNYASFEMVESAFGTPVFIRGPHEGEMNFNSKTSFGYYNPAFISRLRSTVESALKNPVFKKVAQKVYHDNLKNMAHIYRDTYQYMQKERAGEVENLKIKYLKMIAAPDGTTEGAMQEEFRDYDIRKFNLADKGDADEKAGQYNYYDAATAPAFWIRRSIDGTDKEIFEMLDMIVKELY